MGFHRFSTGDRANLADFYKISLDWSYFLCCCPFRLKLVREPDNNNGKIRPVSSSTHYAIVEWLPQKLLCGTLTIFGMVYMTRTMRMSISNDLKSPVFYFDVILTIVDRLFVLANLKQLWFNKERILEIVNFLNSDSSVGAVLPWPFTQKLKCNKVALHLLAGIHSMVAIVMWTGRVNLKGWNFGSWWAAMKESGYSKYSLDYLGGPSNGNNKWIGILAGILGVSTFWQR